MATFCSPTLWLDHSHGDIYFVKYKDRVLYDREHGIEHRHWRRLICAYAKRQRFNTIEWAMREGGLLGLDRPIYKTWVQALADDGYLAIGV